MSVTYLTQATNTFASQLEWVPQPRLETVEENGETLIGINNYAHDAAKWVERSFTIQFWTLLVALGGFMLLAAHVIHHW